MSEIEKAIEYFEDAVKESDEIIADCTEALQAELTEQKQHFIVALEVMRRTHPETKPLSLEELRQMDGDKIYIRYINHCNGIYEDAYAPYFGNKEQFVHRYNGTLRACDLPLKYLGIEWQAFIHKPKQEEKNNVR